MAQDSAPQQTPPQPGGPPSLQIISQYIRDVSFENPNAPESVVSGWPQPEVQVQVFLAYRELKEGMYESVVQFRIEAKRKDDGRAAFIIDLHYAAVAQLENVPQANHDAVIMVDVPRLLFPFAREIIANLTAQGGYPPLYLTPVAFEAIYAEEMARRAQEGGTPPA